MPGCNRISVATHLFDERSFTRLYWGTREMAGASRVRTAGMDQVKNVYARWAAGFAVNEGLYGPNPDTFFHAGLGGTFSLGDPVADVSVSYTPNRLGELFERDPRRRGLVAAVYDCLGG
jgi:CubicO group peptidase (beta-lactamase class C family)